MTDPENQPEEPAKETDRLVIALDAMGGDFAPEKIVDGAIQAVAAYPDIDIVLVGDEEKIDQELKKQAAKSQSISIRHAEQAIGMEESPSEALRKKRNSSIHVGIKMLKEGEASAFISAGNTGAVMAIAAVILRTMEGIERAAIGATLPSREGHTLLIDAGANVVCKPNNLYQFGIMGSVYARYMLDDKEPKVGLLSIGEEQSKGTDTTRSALDLMMKSPAINCIGNVEAKLLYKGVADVVVCDGFTGNIALKVSESLAGMISAFLKDTFQENLRTKLAYLLIKPALDRMKKKIDHKEVGGAPLLGIDGAVFIAHGSSDGRSILNAIRGARKFAIEDVNGHIREKLEESSHILDARNIESPEGILSQIKKKIWPATETGES